MRLRSGCRRGLWLHRPQRPLRHNAFQRLVAAAPPRYAPRRPRWQLRQPHGLRCGRIFQARRI